MGIIPSRNLDEQRRVENGVVYFDRGIIEGRDGRKYDRFAIQTHFVQVGESQKDLVEKYGVSKSPVRDALIAMCADGILKSIPRYGYEVITYSVEDVYSMLQFRLVLESGFLKQRISALTERQIDELEKLNVECQNDDSTPFEHWAANENFHLKLMSFWHNEYALQELRLTMNRLTRAYAQFYWNSNRDVLLSHDTEHHTDIIESLRKKDADTAIEFISQDLHNFGGFEDFFRQAR